ncbi:MAG: hypothetical protein SFX73_18355 [Kofleriaceae bacterium]|nr:hypothetical protein [Kofleriaceae bacterium]
MSRDEECDRILRFGGDDVARIAEALDKQFKLMHDRAQLLLGICGVLISTSVVLMTGKLIGRPDFTHHEVSRVLLWSAGLVEILAAGIVVVGVLRLRWMTQIPGESPREWVMTSLRYRDQKTRAYHAATLLVVVAMAFYQVAAMLAFGPGAG